MPCPSRSDSFDAVTIHHVLHYADDPAAALAEAARVVKPGGSVLVVDFSPHDLVELKQIVQRSATTEPPEKLPRAASATAGSSA